MGDFGEALSKLKDASHELHPNTPGGVRAQEAELLVTAAWEKIDRIPHWRIPNEVNAESATAVRDLGRIIGRG